MVIKLVLLIQELQILLLEVGRIQKYGIYEQQHILTTTLFHKIHNIIFTLNFD